MDQAMLMCGRAPGVELKTGNPMDAPPECQAADDLSQVRLDEYSSDARALSRDNTYVLPPLKKKNITVNGVDMTTMVFSPESEDPQIKEAMDRWMLAAQYCYNVTAFRPAPPHGASQQTPAGMAKLKKYNECRARQAVFSYQCAYRLGRLTKPNCDDEDMIGFCLTGQEACLAARDAQLGLGGAYKNCINGLSLDQLEFVSTMLCGSSRRVQSDILGGQSHGEKITTLGRCAKTKARWQQKMEIEDEAFMQSLQGVDKLMECYMEVENM
jgi:hypothetical protein